MFVHGSSRVLGPTLYLVVFATLLALAHPRLHWLRRTPAARRGEAGASWASAVIPAAGCETLFPTSSAIS